MAPPLATLQAIRTAVGQAIRTAMGGAVRVYVLQNVSCMLRALFPVRPHTFVGRRERA